MSLARYFASLSFDYVISLLHQNSITFYAVIQWSEDSLKSSLKYLIEFSFEVIMASMLYQYMLVPLGVSHKFKTLDNIFNGITLSIYGLFLIIGVLSLATFSTEFEFIITLSAVLFIAVGLKAHKDLKKNFKDFMGMTEAIEDFESKRCSNNCQFSYSLIKFFLSFLTFYISCVLMFMLSPIQDKMFNCFEIVQIKMMLSHHATL